MTDRERVPGARRWTVAVVGCGVIGGGMARRLLALGHRVNAFDLDSGRVERLAAAGARPSASARDAAASADYCLTALPRSEDLRSALLGPQGLLAGLGHDVPVVETSTVAPRALEELAPLVREAGGLLVDAPLCPAPEADDLVSSVDEQANLASLSAAAGMCAFFVGGEPSAVERAQPLLDALGTAWTLMGGLGDGKRAKLLHNAINLCAVAMISEALSAAGRAGIEREAMVRALSHSLADSRILRSQIARFTANDHFPTGLFPLAYGEKDLRYARELFEEARAERSLVTVAHELFRDACRAGLENLYTPGIFRYVDGAQAVTREPAR